MKRKTTKLTAFAAGFLLSFGTTQAAAVEIAQTPLFVTTTANPNIMFILDDSGSMRWGYIPDEMIDNWSLGSDRVTDDPTLCPGKGDYAGVETCFYPVEGRKDGLSHSTNSLYYNPRQSYQPPMRSDGTRHPNASYTAAWLDGYASDTSAKIDLSTNYRAIMDPFYRVYCDGSLGTNNRGQTVCFGDLYYGFSVGSTENDSKGNSGQSGFYYDFIGGENCLAPPFSDSCFSDARNPSTESEKQNFANWFSYYRNRLLMSRAGITAAFIDQSENMRVGYGSINSEDTIVRGVRPFAGDSRAEFFDWLQGAPAIGGTPLRRALLDAGDYFSAALNASENPWRTVPDGPVDNAEYVECRQSFTILMTDGYWNGSVDSDRAVGNVDGADGDRITGPSGRAYQYRAADPFKDNFGDTLADIAMKYWVEDLQGLIENRVPTTDENPAFWQHMTTYGVALGVSGTVDPVAAFKAMEDGDAISWEDPTSAGDSDPSKIDDLLHAAVNSRGGFFSAADPEKFAEELGATIGKITEAVGSASGITFDTATLEEDSLMFSARFDSGLWQGDLDARPLIFNPGDTVPRVGAPVWSAADKLDQADPNLRNIITFNGAAGAPFRSNSLTTSQKDDLAFGAVTEAERTTLIDERLNFLRGDRSLEGNGLRVRGSRLGDIVHSTPVRVARPAAGWPDTANFGVAGNRYSDFRAANSNRTPVIYVGANDGMLHGFKATENGGEEMLAYIPGAVYSSNPSAGLHHLTSTTYSHRYYVDLSPLVSDAYIKTADASGQATTNRDWRTVLFGGLRAGGKGIFALDVTDPGTFSENNAARLALWEFTNVSTDSRKHLGYSIQPPQVALADWGDNKVDYRWTAFVSNGYGSGTTSTGFYMIDIEGGIGSNWVEGTNFQYIELSSTGGGLSPLTLYDFSGNRIVDRVYAGDTTGRMWAAAKGNKGWEPAFNKGVPLFTAPQTGDPLRPQAITAAPMVIPNAGQKPAGTAPDAYVVFGTGKYLGLDDVNDTRQQALYAVRDTAAGNRTITDLARRNLREVQNYDGSGIDALFSEPNNPPGDDDRGWYVNLFEPGERIYLTPQIRGRYIFVNSVIPSTNPCVAGGQSRLMVFGLDGLTPDKAVFKSVPFPVTGFKKIDGIANPSAFLGDFMFTPTSGGGEPDIEGVDVGDVLHSLGRQGWQELIED